MTRYALVIGIAEYSTNSFRSLDTPVHNANAIASILDQHGDFNQVKRLPFRRERGQPELGQVIRKALPHDQLVQEIQQFLHDADGSDVLIYYSGHGFTKVDALSQTPEGYLAPSDCQLEINANGQVIAQKNGVSLFGLNELIKQHRFSNLVVILDCCNSGAFLESAMVRRDATVFGYQLDYYLITACRSSSKSYEGEEYSLLTQAILKGLSPENALPLTGRISGDRLFDAIGNELYNKRQEPIRMGWGRLITLVRYPLQSPSGELSRIEFNPANPYIGLKPFDRDQADYFFGRDIAVRALLDRLSEHRFLAVLGSSGSGKSSLVRAGLFPELESDRIPGSQTWIIERITPRQFPLQELARVLDQHRVSDRPLLLFVDQFEELFTLCPDEEDQRRFIKRLDEESSRTDIQTRIIIAMRGDFLDRCAKFQESADLINSTAPTTYVVTPLTEARLVGKLEEAITCPAKLHGVSFAHNLTSHIVDDVINQPGAMPLLQYALRELWESSISATGASRQLTLESYQAIGGVKGALQRWADEFYANLSPTDQIFVRDMISELVQIGDDGEVTRRRATWDRLREIAASSQQLERIVGKLIDQRLLVADDQTVEVAHEALLREARLIQGWIEENRDSIRLQQRLETYRREWQEHDRSENYLLEAGRLAAIDDWTEKKQPRLGKVDQEFIGQSRERRDRVFQAQLDQERQLKEVAEAKAKAEEEARQKAEEVAIAEAEARKATEKSLQAEQKRLRSEKQRTRFAIGAALCIAAISVFGTIQWRTADREQIRAQTNFARASFTVNRDTFDALLEAMKAGKQLQQSFWFRNDPELRAEVMEVLAQTTNWVREYNRLEGHKNFVWAVSFSPDGQTLATGGEDNALRLWSLDGTEKQELKDHTDQVTGVNFSQDGKFLATCSKDGTIKIRNAQTGQILKPPFEGRKHYRRIRFSPNNSSTVAAVSRDGYITLWNWQTTEPPKVWKGHSRDAYDIDFSRDGQTIVTAGDEGIIKLWNPQGQANGSPLAGHQQAVTAVRFSPDGNTLASGSKDNTVILWNWKQRIKQKTLRGHTQGIYDVQFSSDGKQLATAGDDAVVFLWNQNGDMITTLKRHQERVTSLSFSPDGRRLASASFDNTVKLWQVQPSIRVLKEYAEPVYIVRIQQSKDQSKDQVFATDDGQNGVKLWQLDGKPQSTWQESEAVYSLDFSPKGNIIAVSNGQRINLRNFQGQLVRPAIAQHNGTVLGISFSPDGQMIATSGEDRLAKLWNLSGQLQGVLNGHKDAVRSVRFSPNGQTIATAGWDGAVGLWDSNGSLKRFLTASDSQVYEVAFSPDSQVIAAVGQNPLVKLWKLDGTPLPTLEGHTKAVTDVSFSPNGQLVATSSDDGTIKLWTRDSKLFMTLLRQDLPINGISFTPDNQWLIAGSGNKEVLIINVSNLTMEGLMQQGCRQLQDYKSTDLLCKK